MSRLLVAEPDARTAALVKQGLTSAGFTVSVTRSAAATIREAQTGNYDLLLLSTEVPGIDGFDVLRQLREAGNTMAVILVAPEGAARESIAGLEWGANDYLSRPFRFDELVARIRLRIRETQAGTSSDPASFGDLTLDVRNRMMLVGGHAVELSAREFALAEEFMRYPGEALSRQHLLRTVWGFDFDPGSNVVDVYVRYLRNKIGAHHVETVRGLGYRLVSGTTS